MMSSYVNLLDSELVLEHLKNAINNNPYALENFDSIPVPNFPLTSELTINLTRDGQGPISCTFEFEELEGLSKEPLFRFGMEMSQYFSDFFNSRIKPHLKLPNKYNISLKLGFKVIPSSNPEWN